MISEKELLREIEEYESKQPTYQVCEKLATLYIIHDHLYHAEKTRSDIFKTNHSFDSGPKQTEVEEKPERKIILPAYESYIDAKTAYQYGEISIERVLKTFKTLSEEIKDFIKMLYRNTDTPEERQILNTLIGEINVGNI